MQVTTDGGKVRFTKTSQEMVVERGFEYVCIFYKYDVVFQKGYINNITRMNILRDHSLWSCFVFKETFYQIKL